MKHNRSLGIIGMALALGAGIGTTFYSPSDPPRVPFFPIDEKQRDLDAEAKRRRKERKKILDAHKSKLGKCGCQRCGSPDAVIYRQNTQYVDETQNWVKLCPECREENDDYWADRWQDYYSGLL